MVGGGSLITSPSRMSAPITVAGPTFQLRYVAVLRFFANMCVLPSPRDRSNLLAVVGGGATPRFAENTVLVYDSTQQQFVIELTFSSPVLAVRMRRDRLIITLRLVYFFECSVLSR